MAIRISMPPAVRLTVLIVITVTAILVVLYGLELAIPKRDYFVERRGTLETVELEESADDGFVQ